MYEAIIGHLSVQRNKVAFHLLGVIRTEWDFSLLFLDSVPDFNC